MGRGGLLSAAVVVWCAGVAAGQTANLLPMPREVRATGDVTVRGGVRVVCAGCYAEDQFAAEDLRQTLAERGVQAGDGVVVSLKRVSGGKGPGGLAMDEAMRSEGYVIASSAKGLEVAGETAAGVFYGAQTAKQMFRVRRGGGVVLQGATVRDWPAMRYRGQDDDLSRGPVVTLQYQKWFVRTLAEYKVNVYSPYLENTFAYRNDGLAAPPNGAMTPEDARELVRYAAQYHVTVIPDQEAFGHLHHVLTMEKYSQLAETPHGTLLAPGQAGSLELTKIWFGELAQYFSGPFLHLGADETVDLGDGQTKSAVDAKGLGQVYLDNMQRIVAALEPLGRKLLFWGDVALESPDLVKTMPADFKKATIAVPWEYSPHPSFDKYIKPFTDSGYEVWVAPGVNNWSRVWPNYTMGLGNIQGFIRDGQKLGATGELNTIWNDDGEGLVNQDWYGILFGAAAGWQKGESSIAQFEASFGPVFHGDTTGKINEAQHELMLAHTLLKEQAKVGDASDGLFWMDPWSADGQKYADKIRPYTHEVRMHAERAIELIAEARAAAPMAGVTAEAQRDGAAPVFNAANAYPSAPTTLRERDALDAMELGARRMDFLGLKFQLAEEIEQGYQRAYAQRGSTDRKVRVKVAKELSDINGVDGRIPDLVTGYSTIRGLYEQAWLRSNRTFALQRVLEKYDYTVGVWLARSDKVRVAQRQWGDAHTLPTAADVGVPMPPASGAAGVTQ